MHEYCLYANLVHHYLKQPKEALAILGKTVPHMREDYPIINESLKHRRDSKK
jgi:hypothetical protein